MLPHSTLKAKQRRLRVGFPQQFDHRIHRALSWLQRSESEQEDKDVQFVLLWIAFNAAYAEGRDLASGSERRAFQRFFEKLVELDRDRRIHSATWELFTDEIQALLDNHYIFQPFWSFQNGDHGASDWESRFRTSRRVASAALDRRETAKVLHIVFDRLYVLRNQMIHGGATWNGSVNRSQVNDGAAVLAWLLPIFFDTMMDNPNHDWGRVLYPVHLPRTAKPVQPRP